MALVSVSRGCKASTTLRRDWRNLASSWSKNQDSVLALWSLDDEVYSTGFNDRIDNSWEETDVGDPGFDEDPTLQHVGDPLLDEYTKWSRSVMKTVESLVRKRESLSNELKKAKNVEETTRRGQLITSNMYLFTNGVRSAIVNDWDDEGKELQLTLDDSYDSASAEADALFQQARKLKRGSAIVKDLLKQTNEALSTLDDIAVDLKACLSLNGAVEEDMFRLIQNKLIRTTKTTGFSPLLDDDGPVSSSKSKTSSLAGNKRKPDLGTPASNIRKLKSPGGCIVLVGRNRRGNEHLTFSVARGDDIWMHARGCPGAHVLIQQRRGSAPVTDECIQYAADLAVFYSDARSERSFAVTSAEPKHLLKPRGAPLGAVKLREEHKIYTGYPEQVDEELVLAREESGQADTYRFNDKAKHRRRTTDTAKQEQARRRQKAKEKRKRKNVSGE
ncbi:hypothetical protein ACA910_008549 [Epithemia clementina (nom. ined.)]